MKSFSTENNCYPTGTLRDKPILIAQEGEFIGRAYVILGGYNPDEHRVNIVPDKGQAFYDINGPMSLDELAKKLDPQIKVNQKVVARRLNIQGNPVLPGEYQAVMTTSKVKSIKE